MIRTTLITLFAAAGLVAQAATISATTPPSYSVGDSVAVSISVLSVTDLYAYQFDLSFDPTVLSAQSVTEGGYFSSNGVSFSSGTIDNTGGTISFIADSLSGPGPGFTGDTVLATADFTALGGGTTSVVPINITLLDSNLADIATTASGVSVTVSGTAISGAPEPGSLGLLGAGLAAGLIALSRRVKQDR